MKVLAPNIKFSLSHAAVCLPGNPPISNLDILQHFPRTADKSLAFQEKFAEKIEEDFGFKTRYWCHKPWESLDDVVAITSESLAIACLTKLIPNLGTQSVDAFVLGSTTNKRYSGSQASATLGHFGLTAPAYDFKAGCSTSLATLHLAYSLMNFGYDNVLASCAETLSKVIDNENEKTWIGLADGAAAVFLEKNEKGPFCVERSFFSTDGQYVDAYTTRGLLPPTHYQLDTMGYHLVGDETLLKTLALEKYQLMIKALLPSQEERSAVTWVIPHQVNKALIEHVLNSEGLSHAELLWDGDEIGNIGGASILYTLARAVNEGVFNKKGKILLMSVGGGLSFAAQLISCNG